MVAFSMGTTRILTGTVAASILLPLLAVGAVGWAVADQLVHPARDGATATPADHGLAFERVDFASVDGTRLAGWWMPAGAALGTVVFLHGYSASKAQSLAVAPFLVEAGYNVLAFDFRAHGESDGAYTTVGLEEAKDVRAAAKYAALRAGAPDVALFGWSMGAAAALHAAPDLPEVRAVIADSAFARLSNVLANNLRAFTGLPEWPFGTAGLMVAGMRTGHNVADNEPERAVPRLDSPLLLIQGMMDGIARKDDAEALTRAKHRGGAEMWLVPEARHTGAREVVPAEYEARVLAFLAAHFDRDLAAS